MDIDYKFNKWLLENEHSPLVDEKLNQILDSQEIEYDDKIVGAAWARFRRSIAERRRNLWRMVGAAAALIPLVFSILLLNENKDYRDIRWMETSTRSGEIRAVTLPDNSVITLYSCSKLIYPDKFTGSTRKVFVEGAAFADISENRRSPFVMSAGELEIQVMGTRFEVKSHIEDSECKVALVSGSVSVRSRLDNGMEMRLVPGEIAVLDKRSDNMSKRQFITDCYMDSIEYEGIHFVNDRLCDIVSSLERKFGEKIFLMDESLGDERYYISFVNDESLDIILNTINVQDYLEIERKEGAYYISKRKKINRKL